MSYRNPHTNHEKGIVLFAVLLAFTMVVKAQLSDPVKWTFVAKKKAANTYEVIISAVFAKPWHLYSQTTPDGGPVPTKITFKKNPSLTMEGKVKEVGAMKTVYEKLFGVDVKYYSEEVNFVQVVKVKGNVKTNITGTVEYMTCDDRQCMPPTSKAFNIQLP
ncbi:protein-disulfide reductase DsbD domain-containing protein [Paraflavitalea speifideaquila]|uniref:protein-disulfide reductase DsbD domain-containing protein n=1 Tax=Paraflavitalea speifideaquila TaxID=3076558 RepID=UPI0028E5C781|nr:protein-disulfide reductase DsbD domain-containing protein [Paraflavitalea speifideiaquila]